MTHLKIKIDEMTEKEYHDMLWDKFLGEHPDASINDAFAFWAKSHLCDLLSMTNSDRLDALVHLYNGNEYEALDKLIEYSIKEDRERQEHMK